MPTISRNYFDFFGVQRKLELNEADLQKRFYELSKQWHPDRFSRKSAAEQAEALDLTSLLNDSYRTLREPVKRAEYLLTEEGFPIGEQGSKDVPPELLEEVFDLNMALEEMKSGDEESRPQLESAQQNFVKMRSSIDGELQRLFSKYDAATAESEDAGQALHEVRGVLNRRRYIENLLRDVDKALHPALAVAETTEDKL